MPNGLPYTESIKRIHIIEESDLARNVTLSGLGLIQAGVPHRIQHFLVLLALSSGIERLLKVRLMLQALDEQGAFLTWNEISSFSHRICDLRDEVAARCFAAGQPLPESIAEDRDFFSHDSLLNEILRFLHEVGSGDRYVHLDGAGGKDNTTEKWLSRRWGRIEGLTVGEEEKTRLISEQRVEEFAVRANGVIIGRLERFLRALARTVTHTGLRQPASGLGTTLYDFLTIRDHEFGTRRYDVINT